MRKKFSVLSLSIGFCVFLAATVLTSVGIAQGQETPQLYNFSYIQVKPGMTLEFEEFIKNSIPALKKMGLSQMDIWRTANFGMSDKYCVVTPLRSPAAMDAELSARPSNVSIGLIPAMSAIQRMVVSIHDFMIVPREDLSIMPKEGYALKMGAILTIGTAPGRQGDFEKTWKEALAVIGKTNVKGILAGKVGYGGNLDEYLVTILYDSFTDMAQNTPLIEKGLSEAKLAPPTGVVYYRGSEVFVNIPELRIQPAAQ